jgi:hypothetical protein
VTLGDFGRLWATLGNFGQLWATLGDFGQHLASLGDFGQLWLTLADFGVLFTQPFFTLTSIFGHFIQKLGEILISHTDVG